jgi:hypothetical protein
MSNAFVFAQSRLRPVVLAAGLVTASLLPAAAASSLPAPYVSRALDAVLIPINAEVQKAFGLKSGEKGVLVLSVAPDGVAHKAGIAPGDVISTAHGHAVTDPISLDEIVYHWIHKGSFDFGFNGWHGGAAQTYTSVITLALYTTVIDMAVVSSWSSYSYEGFSYSEYTTEYSSEMTESYESSETTIETTSSSEEFASEETTTEESTTTEDKATETSTETTAEPAAEPADDTAAAPAAEEPAAEEPAAEAPAAEEPAAEAPAESDGGGDAAD